MALYELGRTASVRRRPAHQLLDPSSSLGAAPAKGVVLYQVDRPSDAPQFSDA